MHDTIDVFVVDTSLYIKGADAGKIVWRYIIDIEVVGTVAVRGAVGIAGIAISVNFDATTTKPGEAVDVHIGMFGAFLGGEIVPKGINEPADRASGFVEIDNMIRFDEFGIVFIFHGRAVEGGNEVGRVSNILAKSFVNVPVIPAVIAPTVAKLVLSGEEGV